MPKYVMLPPLNDEEQSWIGRLREQFPQFDIATPTEDQAAESLVDADGAYGWIPPDLLPTAEKLQWLQNPFAGPFEGYYYQDMIDHPVTISNPRGIYSDHIAHHILMFMLALSRGLPYWMDAQRARRWDQNARKRGYVNIVGSTVLINGVGGIGAETARLCAALGARVIGIDPRPERESPAELHGLADLDGLLPEADFVVTTVPHTPETEGMWNAERFSLMKSSAYFINIGRGMTTRLDDLVEALESHAVAGAALDVFEIEPLPEEHPLWTMENVLITPHVAVAEAADLSERRFEIVAENMRRFLDGRDFINVVDKAKWY
jgi:phosphoglycerate dehydrogenase-like enzyme